MQCKCPDWLNNAMAKHIGGSAPGVAPKEVQALFDTLGLLVVQVDRLYQAGQLGPPPTLPDRPVGKGG